MWRGIHGVLTDPLDEAGGAGRKAESPKPSPLSAGVNIERVTLRVAPFRFSGVAGDA